MKVFSSILFFLIVYHTCFAQIVFEEGYFIKEDGERVNCLIKNVDWEQNPEKFLYKLSEEGTANTATIASVREFAIRDALKYVRYEVDIDQSSNEHSKLSWKKQPEFVQDTLFLKVLVQGKANLFFYRTGKQDRFFFNVDTGKVQQLVYKRFKKEELLIDENTYFRQQLWNAMECPEFSTSSMERIEYREKDLTSFFVTYNKCQGATVTVFEEKIKRDKFNITIRPGMSISSLVITTTSRTSFGNKDADFGNSLGYRLGLEAELILPFHNNKWGIYVEPAYRNFSAESEIRAASINYSALDLFVGVRHYFFLNERSKLFLTASYVISRDFEIEVDFHSSVNDPFLEANEHLAFGLGYFYGKRFSTEIRYHLPHEVLPHGFLSSDYQSLSFILGYTLFKVK